MPSELDPTDQLEHELSIPQSGSDRHQAASGVAAKANDPYVDPPKPPKPPEPEEKPKPKAVLRHP